MSLPKATATRQSRMHRGLRFQGFTMVELVIAVGVGSLILMGAMQLISAVRNHWIVGSVNLSNLQEARTALAYLRRDFSSASPRLFSSDPLIVQEGTLANPFKLDATALPGQKTEPIQIINHRELSFYRFLYETTTGVASPRLQNVRYEHDPTPPGFLTRTLDGKQENAIRFKGIKEASFGLYVHPSNPEVPFLLVKLKVFDQQFAQGSANPEALEMEITTSMACPFVSSTLNHPNWNFTTFSN